MHKKILLNLNSNYNVVCFYIYLELNYMSDPTQSDITLANKPYISFRFVQLKSPHPVLVECTVRFFQLHFGDTEMVLLKEFTVQGSVR